uniref:Putative structural protein n=1 Tax=viral metagenome TaxID=1070528 RepID=A0A6H1ZA55_9ZZZZ
MPGFTVDTFDKVYCERYQKGVTRYLAEKSDFFAWFKIETDHGEKPWKIAYRTNAVRGGTNIAVALANKSAPAYDEAQPEYAEEHVVVSMNMKAARRTAGNGKAMVKAVEEAVDTSNEEMCLLFEHKLAGTGGGARGRVHPTETIAGSVITLTDPSTAYLFTRGMKVQLSVDNGYTAAAGVRAGTLEILSIDPSTGTLTTTVPILTGIPAAVVSDYIYRESDYDGMTQTTLQGMQAWIPPTAPGAAVFMTTLVRTNHIGALSGTRVAGGAQHILDIIREAGAKNRNNRGRCDTWWVNPLKMAEIDQAVGAKQTFNMKTDYPGIGLKGLRVSTPSGTISVLESSAWPENVSMLTSRSSWILGAIGKCPHPVDDDGQLWHLEALADAIQMRHRAYPQLGCTRPQDSTHISFGA